MSFLDRRSVDDAFGVRPDARLTNYHGEDLAGTRTDFSVPRLTATPEAENISDADATQHTTEEALPTRGPPVIRHVDEGGRILKIGSLTASHNALSSRQKADLHPQGLYLVNRPENFSVDVVFVHDIITQGHPYHGWLNKKRNDYLPDDVERYVPLARVWSYGYHASFDDKTPFSSAANNFLVFYGEQIQRDERNNSSFPGYTPPKLIFICLGVGGVVVKKILLDSLRSNFSIRQSIAKSSQGIVFIDTPHVHESKALATFSTVLKMYPKWMIRDIPDLEAASKELRTVNRDFLSHFTEMPSTFCVVNLYKMSFSPEPNTMRFPPEIERQGRDAYLSVTKSDRFWTISLFHDHPMLISMMTQVRGWARSTASPEPAVPLSQRGSQVNGGVNLLSVDGGGVRGLATLLVIEKIMQEIARIEVAADPSTLHTSRIPADYFDLAGGTSTGGLICIMLFRLRMEIQSAIDEYRRLSPEIFRPSPTRYLGSNYIKTAVGMSWFKGETLEIGVKRIVKNRLSWVEKEDLGAELEDAPLVSRVEATREKSCKTFLCALKKEDNSAVRFRAYPGPDGLRTPFANCKIWEAARATSAAPFYFPTAVVDDVKFWDGGLANNNPVIEVLGERSQLFPQRSINCVISLGTGFSERKPSKGTLAVLGKGKRIMQNLTDVNINHERAKEQLQDVPYFRFNPSTAEDQIGLADYKLLDALARHTEYYLGRDDVRRQIMQCAELLHHRLNQPQRAASELLQAGARQERDSIPGHSQSEISADGSPGSREEAQVEESSSGPSPSIREI